MKVAIVHDDLVQWGGAERVLLALSEIFPEAPIYTSVVDYSNPRISQNFKNKRIITSFMQRLPGWKSLYKPLLPLYPIAFEQFDFTGFDLVISQTTRFAKAIITKPQTRHVCYIHTPPRFLWNFIGKIPQNFYISFLRIYDRISSSRVDQWLSGSVNAGNRLKKVYGVESQVLYPFVDDCFFASDDSFDGGYYLMVARLNNFKNVDIVVKLFNETGDRLKIVGQGPMLKQLKEVALENIEFVGMVEDGQLVNLLQGTRAVIITAIEDFGLVSLETQALGKPVIALQTGGALETVKANKTGVFFDSLDKKSIKQAIEKLNTMKINPKDCLENAKLFSKDKFKKKLQELIL